MIQRDAARDAHSFDIQFRSARGIDAIYIPFIAARNEQIASQAECQPGRIHDVGHERSHCAFRSNLVYGYRGLLAAAAAVGRVNVSFRIQCRICDRMKIRREFPSNLIRKRTARIPVRRDDEFLRADFRRRIRNFCNDVVTRCHHDLSGEIPETDFGPRAPCKLAAGIFDDNFAAGKCGFGSDVFNCDSRHY